MGVGVITERFSQDHDFINDLFFKFKTARINNADNMTDLFNKLINCLKKHSRGEGVLFKECEFLNDELKNKVKEIMDEQEVLKRKLENLYYDYTLDDLEELEQLFKKHCLLEKEEVYPKFDELLTEEQKQRFIEDLEMYS